MKVRNFSHKGLKRLYVEDGVKVVPPDTEDKLRKMLAFLDEMEEPDELRALKTWKEPGRQGHPITNHYPLTTSHRL